MHLAGLIVTTIVVVAVMECVIFTPEQEIKIREYVEAVMECRNNPGLTLSVVKDGEIWSRGYGQADLDTGRPVDNRTVFVVGSLGKAFTMTLLGKYLQENSYDWNTKLANIPNTNYEFEDEERTREITVADILSHQTGLSPVADYGFIGGYPEGTTKDDMVSRLKHVPATKDMRTRFVYNNLMYMLAGQLTEVLARESWEELMTSELLEPIGMRESTILKYSNDVLKDNAAKPYVFKDGEMRPGTEGIYKITPLEPAGSIMSTGIDMARWMDFNLNNATTANGTSIVEPETFTQAFEEHISLSAYTASSISLSTPTYPVNDVTSGYGFAWFTANYRGHKKVWHSGGLFSYVSLIWMYPDDKVGIFASVNGPGLPSNSGVALNTIFWFLSDLLLGYEPWINPVTACSYPSPWKNSTSFNFPGPKTYTNKKTEDFVGTYGSDLLPDVTISMETNSPTSESDGRLRFVMNRVQGDLHPTKDDHVLDFQMTDPWEYAIERVLSENFILRYPVEFVRSTGSGNGSAENEVIGFDIRFEGRSFAIPYRKKILPFVLEDNTSSAPLLEMKWTFIATVFYSMTLMLC